MLAVHTVRYWRLLRDNPPARATRETTEREQPLRHFTHSGLSTITLSTLGSISIVADQRLKAKPHLSSLRLRQIPGIPLPSRPRRSRHRNFDGESFPSNNNGHCQAIDRSAVGFLQSTIRREISLRPDRSTNGRIVIATNSEARAASSPSSSFSSFRGPSARFADQHKAGQLFLR